MSCNRLQDAVFLIEKFSVMFITSWLRSPSQKSITVLVRAWTEEPPYFATKVGAIVSGGEEVTYGIKNNVHYDITCVRMLSLFMNLLHFKCI